MVMTTTATRTTQRLTIKMCYLTNPFRKKTVKTIARDIAEVMVSGRTSACGWIPHKIWNSNRMPTGQATRVKRIQTAKQAMIREIRSATLGKTINRTLQARTVIFA